MYEMTSPSNPTPQIHKLWSDDELTMTQQTHSISPIISPLEMTYQSCQYSL